MSAADKRCEGLLNFDLQGVLLNTALIAEKKLTEMKADLAETKAHLADATDHE
jgi:hypothetical protein